METPVPIEQASLPAEVELTERQQQILGCVACISGGGDIYATEMNRQVVTCTGLTRGKVHHSLTTLQAEGLIDSQPRSEPARPGTIGPSLTEHTITRAGQQLLPESWQPCAKQENPGGPLTSLTKLQKSFMQCISCLTARGKDPTSLDIATCTGRTVDTTTTMLYKFVKQDLLSNDKEADRPRKQGGKAPLRYSPTPETEPYMPKAPSILDCSQFNKEAEALYASFTPQQRRVLGCVACLANKVKQKEISGATNGLIAACQDIPYGSVVGTTARFIELGVLDAEDGYSKSAKRKMLSPTQLGRKLFTLTTLADTCVADTTSADLVATHLEKMVTKCVGCIWAKQTAVEEKLGATTSMVAHCSRLSLKSVQVIIKRMAEEGKLERTIAPTNIMMDDRHPVVAYAPVARLRALPPTGGSKCRLPLYTDAPAHFLRPITTDVLRNPPRYKATATFLEPWFQRNMSHEILSREEESALVRIVQNKDDPEAAKAALNIFMTHNFRLAVWGVRQAQADRIFLPFEDALQVAQGAILAAVQRFDPERDIKFSTYARYWLQRDIQRATAKSIDVPLHDYVFFAKIYFLAEDFRRLYDRYPSIIEIAQEFQIKPTHVDRILERKRHATNLLTTRLDNYLNPEESEATFYAVAGENDQGFARADIAASIERFRTYLSPVENDFLTNIVQDMGLVGSTITAKHNIARENIGRIKEKIGSLIRHPYFGILATLDSSFEWQEEAACSIKRYDRVVTKGSGNVANRTRAICQSCPVNQACESFAKNAVPPVTVGIWNGRNASTIHNPDVIG